MVCAAGLKDEVAQSTGEVVDGPEEAVDDGMSEAHGESTAGVDEYTSAGPGIAQPLHGPVARGHARARDMADLRIPVVVVAVAVPVDNLPLYGDNGGHCGFVAPR